MADEDAQTLEKVKEELVKALASKRQHDKALVCPLYSPLHRLTDV
jgi:hypothetical protein